MQGPIEIKNFLKYVDISELQNKICEFRDLDFKNMSYGDIKQAILKVILFNTPYGNISILMPTTGNYPVGTIFYRVREILPSDDRKIPLKSMSYVSDCWSLPENKVRLGRLNKEKESLLYTALQDPSVAIEELKIPDDELFSLIIYKATQQINVNVVGFLSNSEKLNEDEKLNKDEKLKVKMIQDFLKHEFIRDVGVGTEYLYQFSESIAKDHFDLPSHLQDAWCYPSIAKKGGYNVCFRKDKCNKLELIGVQITSVHRINVGYRFDVKCIAVDCGNGINLSYHGIGSEIQKKLFPEIIRAGT